MKELKAIYKSTNYKEGHYTVDVVNENIYEWKGSLVRSYKKQNTFVKKTFLKNFKNICHFLDENRPWVALGKGHGKA